MDLRFDLRALRTLAVDAVIHYGCALSLMPVTRIRCHEITEGLDARAYAKSGLRDLEAFLERGI